MGHVSLLCCCWSNNNPTHPLATLSRSRIVVFSSLLFLQQMSQVGKQWIMGVGKFLARHFDLYSFLGKLIILSTSTWHKQKRRPFSDNKGAVTIVSFYFFYSILSFPTSVKSPNSPLNVFVIPLIEFLSFIGTEFSLCVCVFAKLLRLLHLISGIISRMYSDAGWISITIDNWIQLNLFVWMCGCTHFPYMFL